jgi:hypothetical protein
MNLSSICVLDSSLSGSEITFFGSCNGWELGRLLGAGNVVGGSKITFFCSCDGWELGRRILGVGDAVGKLVGSFDGTTIGLLVAPKSVGSILAVAFEGRNVGLGVICNGAGLGRSVTAPC